MTLKLAHTSVTHWKQCTFSSQKACIVCGLACSNDQVDIRLNTFLTNCKPSHTLHSLATTNSSSCQHGAVIAFVTATAVFSSLRRAAPNTLRDTKPQNKACRARIRGLRHDMGILQSLSITLMHMRLENNTTDVHWRFIIAQSYFSLKQQNIQSIV